MRRLCIKVLFLFSILTLPYNAFSQWKSKIKFTTEPDNSILTKRKFWISGAYEYKLFNFHALHHSFPLIGHTDYNIGDPSVGYLTFPLDIGYTYYYLKTLKNEALYSSILSGVLVGRGLSNKSDHPIVRPFISAGMVYAYSVLFGGTNNINVNYYIGNWMARFQLMLEYPKGQYAVDKTKSYQGYRTFAFIAGYDLPIVKTHLFNTDAYGANLYPNMNSDGFYIGLCENIHYFKK